MSFAHLNFLPFLDSRSQIPSIETILSLSTFTPFLIPISISEEIILKLPANAEFYVYDDLATQLQQEEPQSDQARRSSDENHRIEAIINLLNRGSTKVITNLTSQLVELGVPIQRIIHKISSSSGTQTADLSNTSKDYDSTLIEIDPDTPSTDLENLSNSLQSLRHTTFVLDPLKRLGPTQSSKSDLNLHPNLIQVISSSDLVHTSLDQLIDLFLCRLRTDRPDGLYTTSVVSLSPSSTLLGQVYSSFESIKLSIKTQRATYFSRSRNQIWLKGETSGATQKLIRIRSDCDRDCLEFQVIQKPSTGFCHTEEISCFGPLGGLKQLESTLIQRQQTSIPGSYTNRLFNDEKLLRAKIMEEAEELCQAQSPEEVEGEMADLIYFALCRCISKGVNLADVEKKLNQRSLKVTRRKGDAKPKWINKLEQEEHPTVNPSINPHPASTSSSASLRCQVIDLGQVPDEERHCFLKRPMADSQTMTNLVRPIIDMVKNNGDQGLLEAVRKFDKHAYGGPNDLILSSPFPDEMKSIDPEIQQAIDVAYQNIYKFHAEQLEKEKSPAVVETMKGVVCSRFARPIDRVGLYVPGGTAVLPSTALMLAIPAQVAGCSQIMIATPPRKDGTISPEIVYIASKCGVNQIVKAGGAHAIAALAYGTKTVAKVDKIFGPGNQFVTVAKMIVASDVQAGTAIDMPAGPSEVLVIADKKSNPTFVAADLLSQAEHGIDSQVILLSVDQPTESIAEIERQIHLQAQKLSRSAIISQSIPKSFIVKVPSIDQAFDLSNHYAPEHLILHLENPKDYISRIRNAGSVFIGAYSPESCGDYASGTNHSLPTVGFAKQYSGVSTMSFMKHITAQELTKEGLMELGPTVIRLANLEGLDGHANAVQVRLDSFSV